MRANTYPEPWGTPAPPPTHPTERDSKMAELEKRIAKLETELQAAKLREAELSNRLDAAMKASHDAFLVTSGINHTSPINVFKDVLFRRRVWFR